MAAAARPADPALAFDGAAARYDEDFSRRPLGWRLRQRVWSRMDAVLRPGDWVLDVGCGTGEDAVHLANRGVRVHAVDRSRTMVRRAWVKAEAGGVADRIRFEVRDATTVVDLAVADGRESVPPHGDEGQAPRGGPPADAGPFDAAISNFGVLNCVPRLDPVAQGFAAVVRPGGTVLVVLMGPFCLWETLWFLGQRQPSSASRRWRGWAKASVAGRPVVVRYWSPRTVRRAFAPWFDHLVTAPVGLVLPPTDALDWAERRPGRLATLDRWDARLSRVPGAAWVADHFLVRFVRREVGL